MAYRRKINSSRFTVIYTTPRDITTHAIRRINNDNNYVNTILYGDDQILLATSEDDLQTIAHHLNLIGRKYEIRIK